MDRKSEIERKTKETNIRVSLDMSGQNQIDISTGIAFFDHMLTLFAIHGFFDLSVQADGDLDVDLHHTVEDVGLVLGEAFDSALNNRQGIKRYGHSVTPMDESLAAVTVDLSKRPYLVFNVPSGSPPGTDFDSSIAKEFFRAFVNRAGMNLHINVAYGENEHHILEAVFKGLGRALNQASTLDDKISGVRSSKGSL